jgi:hypothetical protein
VLASGLIRSRVPPNEEVATKAVPACTLARLSVPPARENGLESLNAPAVVVPPDRLSVPPESLIEAAAVRLWIVSVTFWEWVTIAPAFRPLTTTSSAGPGRAWVIHLVVVSQSPPAGLIQVTVDRSVRSSRTSIASLNRAADRDRGREAHGRRARDARLSGRRGAARNMAVLSP